MHTHRLMRRIVLVVAVIAWVGWEIPQAWAQRARVPQTGQTECWQSGGGPIDCTGTGQDGDIQAGVEWPSPRFTDRGNGTVRDNLTGLLWLKNANCFDLRAWQQALTDANTLHDSGTPETTDDCGLSDGSEAGDWRLPNVKELLSLMDYSQVDPALPAGHPFLNVVTMATRGESAYWTSTTRVRIFLEVGMAEAFAVRLEEGMTWIFTGPLFHYFVWPVRGGD